MISFWFKESLKLIWRAKSSFLLSLISMSISVILIISSLLLIDASTLVQNKIKQNIEINVFLKDYANDKTVDNLQAKFKKLNFIHTVRYIDKKEAAKIFIRETGEDFQKFLGYNPLPASFSITLNEQFVTKDSLNKIISLLKGFDGVDEIVYKHDFTEKILSYLDKIKEYIFAAAALILLISIYIIFSTIKLIITSKYNELETMKLVGAKLTTIKMPILINGILIGIIGAILAFLALGIFVYYFDTFFQVIRIIKSNRYLYLYTFMLLGPVLGFLVSLFSLRKVSLKI